MYVFTDNIQFARQLCPDAENYKQIHVKDLPFSLQNAARALFFDTEPVRAESDSCPDWQYLFAVGHAPASQMESLAGIKDLPDKLLCLAASGQGFKGFRNRSWVAEAGNLHLTAHLNPGQKIEKFSNGFTMLAAVSVLESLEKACNQSGHYQIRWINDIVRANKKVAGVLTRSQLQGEMVTGVQIGIGINVHAVPDVETDMFVPAVTSVSSEFKTSLAHIFQLLCGRLSANYKYLITDQYDRLWQKYSDRSMVLGKHVTLFSDPYGRSPEKIISGIVAKIGENLELYFDDSEQPYPKGRVVIDEQI